MHNCTRAALFFLLLWIVDPLIDLGRFFAGILEVLMLKTSLAFRKSREKLLILLILGSSVPALLMSFAFSLLLEPLGVF